MATQAQLKAAKKYIKEKTDEIKVRVPKGTKLKIEAFAKELGKSMNSYISNLIFDDMKNEAE